MLDQIIYGPVHGRETIAGLPAERYRSLARAGRSVSKQDMRCDARRIPAGQAEPIKGDPVTRTTAHATAQPDNGATSATSGVFTFPPSRVFTRQTGTSLLTAAAALSWCAAFAAPLAADVALPHVIGEHMVLQRDMPLTIWGWADPGESVTVRLDVRQASTMADSERRWAVRLPPLPAGGPHVLEVCGKNQIRLTDVLVGEVWVCSGQSNMEMGLGVVENGEQEVAAADCPQIRLLQVSNTSAGQPAPDIEGEWRVCNPENVGAGGWGGFSAVGYFFGRELHRELGVPIGLIDATWGGTRIEPWTPAEGFELVPALHQIRAEIEQAHARYREQLPASLDSIETWTAKARTAMAAGQRELPPPPQWPRHPLDRHDRPTGLYNGMIAPLVPLAIRGVIWYQGEANVLSADGMLYHEKMKALIGGWRRVWGQDGLPFYYVQLAPFDYRHYKRDCSPYVLPEIWEAQTAALAIPNTGMVVTTDIATRHDIHPGNKREVGRRLALWALARTYGRDAVVCSGPLYRASAVEGDRIRIRFDHVGSGLASRDGRPLNWFEIAGEDRQFVPAQAEIDGDTVVVRSDKVARPAAVRFGWHQEADPNLINKEGLPAAPFRTQPW